MMNNKKTHSFKKKHYNNPSPVNQKSRSNLNNQQIYRPKTRQRLNLSDIIKIASLNIKGITDVKKQFLIDILGEYNITILGLSETNISNKMAKHSFNFYRNNYVTYFANEETNYRGNGVGLIIKKNYARHIVNYNSFKGRIIYVDFIFSGNKKMRIINYYGKSGRVTLDNFNQEVKIYFDKIKELVRESKAQNAEIILLGDFNLHYEKYLDDKNNNRKMKKEHKLFEWIEDEQNFYDPFYIMFDNLSQHSLNTFYPFNTNQNPSRIDYIWVTENLFSETQECKIVNTTTINTDHRMLVYSIWSEDLIGNIANIKRKEGFKEVYKYDKMDGEQWELFQNDLNKYISNSEILKFNFNDKNNINHIWDKIKKGLVQASKNCIPIEKIKLTKSQVNPMKISNAYKVMKFLINFRRSIKDSRKRNHVIRNWITYRKKLLEIGREKSDYCWNKIPKDDKSVKEIFEEIKNLYQIYLILYNHDLLQFKEEKIKLAIDQRCEDLLENQKRMINSVMEREIKSIVLDRVLIKENNEDKLITDEEKIKDIVNDHFQNIAGSTNQPKILSEYWAKFYFPQDEINDKIYKDLMVEPTNDELNEALNKLSNNKASGPTGISNEMLKHASPEFKEIIRKLIILIFNNQEIPLEWKYANVYPIPKPKPWGCQLVNTRPITLLETARKLMVSIMNARLSTILQKNKILKGLQFAGLPFSSTFEPLRIINEIIQDANENDKELWILSLDMSKAYDRVNIFMLEKAMQRLKIPSSFINLTKELFLGRKNSVFTAGGLSNPYDVMVGIDQGEIISPLLWCIYYDPLLTAIQQEHFGYRVKAKKKINLYENIEVEVKQNITSMAYMDDTNMLAGNKEELEKILKMADDFYTLNDIQINKEKSELLLKKKNFNFNEKIELEFGNQKIKIKPKGKTESLRILGVWFNIYNDNNFIKQQAFDEVKNLSNNLLKNKCITDKISSYIFNAVILPRIEYRTQTIILSEKDCEKIMVPYRKNFKNKLKLASTAPNIIMELNLLYNIRSIFDNQLQAKVNNFIIQINDQGILGKIMEIRLVDIQNKLLLPFNPLINFPFSNKDLIFMGQHLRNNFIINNLLLMKSYNFSIEFNKHNIGKNSTVLGRGRHIMEIVGTESFLKNIKILRMNNLYFLDQFLSPDNKTLLTWWNIKNKIFALSNNRNSNVVNTPNIYKKIQSLVTTNGKNYNVKEEYIDNNVVTNLGALYIYF
ncbi:RNA-directed DNA polymerase from mobile element jockey-like [Rhizophagus irregularis DAOM 181602=DAOM 197198]|nr:RNA-directed DNA polymerase from mobile element jockey-like [Rhizophagus irregularis DAOM 181602=DAOM 197198]